MEGATTANEHPGQRHQAQINDANGLLASADLSTSSPIPAALVDVVAPLSRLGHISDRHHRLRMWDRFGKDSLTAALPDCEMPSTTCGSMWSNGTT